MASYAGLWRARVGMMRPGNCLMAAVGTATGIAVVGGVTAGPATWIAAAAAAFLLAAFGNVLNDLRDHELDARAHPGRALPSGRVSRRDAMLSAALFLGLGLWEAFVAGGLP